MKGIKVFLAVMAVLVFFPGLLSSSVDWAAPYLPIVGLLLIMSTLGKVFSPVAIARQVLGLRGGQKPAGRGGGLIQGLAISLVTEIVAMGAQLAVATLHAIGRGTIRGAGFGARWYAATHGNGGHGHASGGHSGEFPTWPQDGRG